MTNPPLTITEEELAEAFGIIDARARPRRPGRPRLAPDPAPRRPSPQAFRDDPGIRTRSGAARRARAGRCRGGCDGPAAVPGFTDGPGDARDEANAYLVEDARDIEASPMTSRSAPAAAWRRSSGRWQSPGGKLLRTILALVAFFVIVAVAWEAVQVVLRRPVALREHPGHRRLDRSTSRRSACSRRPTSSCPTSGTSRTRSRSRSSATRSSRCSSSWSAPRSTPGRRRSSASSSAPSSASCWPRSSSTSRLAERAFVPYVIASQTIPIVALAPIIVVGFGRGPDVRRHHRHVPHVLPGDHRDDARPALARPAGAGADALVRGVARGRSTGRCACRRPCRTCSPRSRSRRPRASWAPSSARGRAASRTAWAAPSSTSTSSTSPARRSCGRTILVAVAAGHLLLHPRAGRRGRRPPRPPEDGGLSMGRRGDAA